MSDNVAGRFAASRARGIAFLSDAQLVSKVNDRVDYSSLTASKVRATTYSELWRKCVDEDLYDVGLVDGSLFQFRGGSAESYCFLDTPVAPQSFEDYMDEQLGPGWLKETGEEYVQVAREDYEAYVDGLEFSRPATPIRYDVSFGQFRAPCHPAAHLHFGFSNHIRVATRRLWSPEAFVFFVVRQYFPEAWIRLVNKERPQRFTACVRDNLELFSPQHWKDNQECETYLY